MTAEQKKWITQTPRMYFDTRNGINMTLREKPETALQEVSLLRQLFCELHQEEKLIEFVVDGEYLLDRHGELHHIDDEVPNKEECLKYGRTLIVEDFLRITHLESYNATKLNYKCDVPK